MPRIVRSDSEGSIETVVERGVPVTTTATLRNLASSSEDEDEWSGGGGGAPVAVTRNSAMSSSDSEDEWSGGGGGGDCAPADERDDDEESDDDDDDDDSFVSEHDDLDSVVLGRGRDSDDDEYNDSDDDEERSVDHVAKRTRRALQTRRGVAARTRSAAPIPEPKRRRVSNVVEERAYARTRVVCKGCGQDRDKNSISKTFKVCQYCTNHHSARNEVDAHVALDRAGAFDTTSASEAEEAGDSDCSAEVEKKAYYCARIKTAGRTRAPDMLVPRGSLSAQAPECAKNENEYKSWNAAFLRALESEYIGLKYKHRGRSDSKRGLRVR